MNTLLLLFISNSTLGCYSHQIVYEYNNDKFNGDDHLWWLQSTKRQSRSACDWLSDECTITPSDDLRSTECGMSDALWLQFILTPAFSATLFFIFCSQNLLLIKSKCKYLVFIALTSWFITTEHYVIGEFYIHQKK